LFIDNILPKIIGDSALGRPKWKTRGILLGLENTCPRLCKDEFEELGIRRLLYSPNSPGLVPCDFWLFGDPKQCREGQSLDNSMALQAAVSEIVMSIEVATFVKVFAKWKRCLRQCVKEGGD
jgi:hypothetical protein